MSKKQIEPPTRHPVAPADVGAMKVRYCMVEAASDRFIRRGELMQQALSHFDSLRSIILSFSELTGVKTADGYYDYGLEKDIRGHIRNLSDDLGKIKLRLRGIAALDAEAHLSSFVTVLADEVRKPSTEVEYRDGAWRLVDPMSGASLASSEGETGE